MNCIDRIPAENTFFLVTLSRKLIDRYFSVVDAVSGAAGVFIDRKMLLRLPILVPGPAQEH